MRDERIIGIIGQGFVGTAVREKFRKSFPVLAWDKQWSDMKKFYGKNEDSMANYDQLEEVVKHSDFVFVCVPTPMYEDGECDTSIVELVLNDIQSACEKNDIKKTAIIKSTVPPGTTDRMNGMFDRVDIMFNPEFLTEANAVNDYENQTRIILGADDPEKPNLNVVSAFTAVFPDATLKMMKTSEAEIVKYMTNLFLATKVSFFNDMYRFCNTVGANYDEIIDATLLDPRIGKSHYSVPGPDGDFGYGGHCFPKDVNAILYMAQQAGLAMPTLLGAHTTNQIVRSDKDWEKKEGRAVSTKNHVETNELQ